MQISMVHRKTALTGICLLAEDPKRAITARLFLASLYQNGIT
jgi:hypothetical protein